MVRSKFVDFRKVDLNNGFWHDRYVLNRQVSVKNVMERFEQTGRMDALRFNFAKTGKRPHIFYDSDVAKWIEAVSYLYIKNSDEMQEYIDLCEELIDSMAENQRDDGYLNSTHQQITPSDIFKIRNNHELYCAGHLIEAAIAYHTATGKDKFLKVMEKYCDCIENNFIKTKVTADFITPGHEEIELALIKLYRHTKNRKYFDMAKFFLVNRGKYNEQYVYDGNRYGSQDDTDIYHLKNAEGHSVRALYLYCGIADLAAEESDVILLDNLKSIFNDIAERKMYITGGVGSTYRTESFTKPYDLPNMTAYSESCCAIGMLMFLLRMRQMDKNSKYGDVAERVLYNSMLSSTSLDGRAFFYENPLEIALEEYDREISVPKNKRERLPITQRQEEFECSCCPPNINRFFAQLGNFIALEENDSVCIEQYIPSLIKTDYGEINITGEYAISGKVQIKSDVYSSNKVYLRYPMWCERVEIRLNGKAITPEIIDGYISFDVKERFIIDLDFNIAPKFISANPNVRANIGRVALSYGPIIYCIEGVDNGDRLNKIEVNTDNILKAEIYKDFHGLNSIELPALRIKDSDRLYFNDNENTYREIKLKYIPYFAFANRGTSDMLIFVRKH